MTDIDFDELDKAVNSLMNNANETASKDEKPTEAAAPKEEAALAEAAPVVEQPKSESPAETTTPVQPAKPSVVAAPARKRSGRFMDMVHPSADMGKREAVKVSREGATLTPPAEVSAPTPEVPAVPEEPSASPAPAPAATMPDPIEVANAKNEAELTAPEHTSLEETSGQSGVKPDNDQLSDSPFLPDAKVEKRPLGGEATGKEEGNNTTEVDDTAEPNDGDEPPAQPTQAELGADVVAVEANEPKSFAEVSSEPTEQKTEPKKEAAAVAAGSGSITQQYKEEPSSGDASHTAIYDAANYPTTAPKQGKKKSGWLWILWIFILLSLGAGGAVVLYLMNII